MDTDTIPVLLVTANVGSIFEAPDQMIKGWCEEFLSTIAQLSPKFIALHCQELGGKNYEKTSNHVESFVKLLMSSEELKLFNKIQVFLDEDYSSVEQFTALGNLYFVHESIEDVRIWDFKNDQFLPVNRKEIHSGNIESVITKEKAKFPQDFFPECKWSRKGFLRTRWSINGTVFDMVNIHLFHDASNFIAMESFPSVYSTNRRRALEYTLERFHTDSHGKAPYFIFGDFNFRTDTNNVVKKITEGLNTTRLQNSKANDSTKLHYTNQEDELILSIGKKEFQHTDHTGIFTLDDTCWLRAFDKEMGCFESYVTEYPVTFPPSYPFEEKVDCPTTYMPTRCPAWCDRVLLSHTAKDLVSDKKDVEYGIIGLNTCMGDHKPVYLKFSLNPDTGIVKCCDHVPFECLPEPCQCCQNYASVKINIVDMSEQMQNSLKIYEIDSRLLHEPLPKDRLTHEPYTPESAESHSPFSEKINTFETSVSVPPNVLKSKLEHILENEAKPLFSTGVLEDNSSRPEVGNDLRITEKKVGFFAKETFCYFIVAGIACVLVCFYCLGA